MPLIAIRRCSNRFTDEEILKLMKALAPLAAKVLTCAEGSDLKPQDIMFEVNDMGPLDLHRKDLHIRVIAHDYPFRRLNLEAIQQEISDEVIKHLPQDRPTSWYVWVFLAPTAYGSDTDS